MAVAVVVPSAVLEHLTQVRQIEDRMVLRAQTILDYKQRLLLLTLHGSVQVQVQMTVQHLEMPRTVEPH
jgi:hypothetical protein